MRSWLQYCSGRLHFVHGETRMPASERVRQSRKNNNGARCTFAIVQKKLKSKSGTLTHKSHTNTHHTRTRLLLYKRKYRRENQEHSHTHHTHTHVLGGKARWVTYTPYSAQKTCPGLSPISAFCLLLTALTRASSLCRTFSESPINV